MSRQHARIFTDGEQCWVEDLNSANGVFVGFERVTRAPIPPGEVVVIGSLLVQVLTQRRGAAAAEAVPQGR